MDLLIDTHALLWTTQGSYRLSKKARAVIVDRGNQLFLSAVTAWEFADLQARERLPAGLPLQDAIDMPSLQQLSLPADLWREAARLPNIHGDPVDRMLVAHAMVAGMTLVTADADMRSYPVATLW